MRRAETLAVHSIEGFLDRDECGRILDAMEVELGARDPAEIEAGRTGSVHTIDGLDVGSTVAVYEPRGRTEMVGVPPDAHELLVRAFVRALDRIRIAVPSARDIDTEWLYVEYGPGQHVTSHVDYSHNERRPTQPKVATVSVQLTEDFDGGELYVETTSSPALWTDGAPDAVVRPDAHVNSDWFRAMRRTRWTSTPALGTAYIFGTQLVHGTNPVSRGIAKKALTFITE